MHQMRSTFALLGPEQTNGILDSLGWKDLKRHAIQPSPSTPPPSRAWCAPHDGENLTPMPSLLHTSRDGELTTSRSPTVSA